MRRWDKERSWEGEKRPGSQEARRLGIWKWEGGKSSKLKAGGWRNDMKMDTLRPVLISTFYPTPYTLLGPRELCAKSRMSVPFLSLPTFSTS
jgi:hypothetical protein